MRNKDAVRRLSLKNPAHLLALGLGSGLAPIAPGTFGSIAAIPFCLALIYSPLWVHLLTIVIVFIIGVKVCSICEHDMNEHDNSSLVIDEFVGMFISCLGFPQHWQSIILAFLLFRIFDVLKPFPISYLDKKVKGGFGVMIDDVLAGIFALIVGHVILLCV